MQEPATALGRPPPVDQQMILWKIAFRCTLENSIYHFWLILSNKTAGAATDPAEAIRDCQIIFLTMRNTAGMKIRAPGFFRVLRHERCISNST